MYLDNYIYIYIHLNIHFEFMFLFFISICRIYKTEFISNCIFQKFKSVFYFQHLLIYIYIS